MDGIQNIQNADGLGIALTGMVIVFSGLILISLFIAALPRVLHALSGVLPPESAGHGHSAASRPPEPAADEGEVLAALGFALHLELEKRQ